MNVKDIMTTNVVAVGRDASLKQVAELMAEHKISGVPVVNAERRVLGVASEADIIVKAASRPASVGLLGDLVTQKVDQRDLAAATAGEAMTAPAVTMDAEETVAEAARLMDCSELRWETDDRAPRRAGTARPRVAEPCS
jgi:CBS domain-containing protein